MRSYLVIIAASHYINDVSSPSIAILNCANIFDKTFNMLDVL